MFFTNRGKFLIMRQAFNSTASGGPIPASGGAARWLVLLTDKATVGDRQVVACPDLGSDQSITDGQTITLTGATLSATQPA